MLAGNGGLTTQLPQLHVSGRYVGTADDIQVGIGDFGLGTVHQLRRCLLSCSRCSRRTGKFLR